MKTQIIVFYTKSKIKIKAICDNLKEGEMCFFNGQNSILELTTINLHVKPNTIEIFLSTNGISLILTPKNSQQRNGAEKLNFFYEYRGRIK